MLVQNVSLRYFTLLCNNAEYKKMGQDLSLGQLYNVHNEIEIYTKHWLGLLIYHDNVVDKMVSYKLNGSFQKVGDWGKGDK